MDYLQRLGVSLLVSIVRYAYRTTVTLKAHYSKLNMLATFPMIASALILELLFFCIRVGTSYDGGHCAFQPLVSYAGSYYSMGVPLSGLAICAGSYFLLTTIIRYVQIGAIFRQPGYEKLLPRVFYSPAQLRRVPCARLPKFWLDRLNELALIFGSIIFCSFLIAPIFPYSQTSLLDNLVASTPIFLFTPLYIGSHVFFSAQFVGPVNTLDTYHCRLNWFVLNTVAATCFLASIGIRSWAYPNTFLDPSARLAWCSTVDQPGFYWWHLVTCIFEWVFFASMVPFLFSLVPEFSRIDMYGKGDDDDDVTDKGNKSDKSELLLALLLFYSEPE